MTTEGWIGAVPAPGGAWIDMTGGPEPAPDDRPILPYGSWPTPITSDLVVRGASVPNGLQRRR